MSRARPLVAVALRLAAALPGGVTVEVVGAPSDHRRLRTAFREVRVNDWKFTVNGEELFLMGSNQGPTRMALGDASATSSPATWTSRIEANLDLLRLHAHVSRPELYDAADEPACCSGRTYRSSGATRRHPEAGGPPGARDGRPARTPSERRVVVRAQRAARDRLPAG